MVRIFVGLVLPLVHTSMVAVEATTPPSQYHIVSTSFHSQESNIPINATQADLFACSPYMQGKAAGIAASLGINVSEVVLTGYLLGNDATTTVAPSLVRVLEGGNSDISKDNIIPSSSSSENQNNNNDLRALQTTLDVKTQFDLYALTSSAAVALMADVVTKGQSGDLKTKINTQLAAQTWTGETLITSAPVSGTVVMSAPTVGSLEVLSSGSWSVRYYTDASCETLDSTTSQIQGHIGTCTIGSVTNTNSVLSTTCGKTLFLTEYVADTVCDATSTAAGFATHAHSYGVGTCNQEVDSNGAVISQWSKISCSSSALQLSSAWSNNFKGSSGGLSLLGNMSFLGSICVGFLSGIVFTLGVFEGDDNI